MAAAIPILHAMTPEAQRAIGGPRLVLKRLPFRIGRLPSNRLSELLYGVVLKRLRLRLGRASNDLLLPETGLLTNVSRQHLQIERRKDGSFVVLDRGSTCGTLVGGRTVGGHGRRGACALESGDIFVVGTHSSPFVFKFLLVQKKMKRKDQA